jgi:predicted alpha/beta-hydrolase family hydrolase
LPASTGFNALESVFDDFAGACAAALRHLCLKRAQCYAFDMDDVLLVPGFGGTETQPLLVKLIEALAAQSLRASAVTLKKGRPDAKLSAETEQLRSLWRDRTGAKGVIVGRSFGGRVGARVALSEPVRALVLLGFPVRPEGKRRLDDERALAALTCPTLILQGEQDEMGSPELIAELSAGNRLVTLEVIPKAKHSYGRSEPLVIARTADWLAAQR